MSIQDAIDWVQEEIAAITGMGAAPPLPDALAASYSVSSIAYAYRGTLSMDDSTTKRALHTIRIEVTTPMDVLVDAFRRLDTVGLPEAVTDALLADATLGGTVDTYGDITYQFFDSQKQNRIGYVIYINDVKIRS